MTNSKAGMLEYNDYLKIFIALLAVVDPLAALPIMAALTAQDESTDLKAIARIVALSVSIVLLVTLFIGEWVLLFFGISISSFRVSGGILLMIMSLSMLQGKISETVRNKEEARVGESGNIMAIVPLSIPLLAGPGAISTVILYAQKSSDINHYLLISLDIIVVAAMVWIVLLASPWLTERLSLTGVNVIIRLMGLILLALSVEFIAGGLKGLFPLLN